MNYFPFFIPKLFGNFFRKLPRNLPKKFSRKNTENSAGNFPGKRYPEYGRFRSKKSVMKRRRNCRRKSSESWVKVPSGVSPTRRRPRIHRRRHKKGKPRQPNAEVFRKLLLWKLWKIFYDLSFILFFGFCFVFQFFFQRTSFADYFLLSFVVVVRCWADLPLPPARQLGRSVVRHLGDGEHVL